MKFLRGDQRTIPLLCYCNWCRLRCWLIYHIGRLQSSKFNELAIYLSTLIFYYSYIRLDKLWGCLTSANVRLEWQGHSTHLWLSLTSKWVALVVRPGFELRSPAHCTVSRIGTTTSPEDCNTVIVNKVLHYNFQLKYLLKIIMCWWFIGDNVTESNKHIYFSTGTGLFDINDIVQKMAVAEIERILF